MTKGIFYHTIAKIIVILSSYILHLFLGRFLTVEEYGIVGILITITNFYYLFLSNGVRQSISRELSLGSFSASDIVKKSMHLQIVFGITLGVLNLVLAPYIARLFGNNDLKQYFMVLSILIPFTAIYFGLSGALNGMKLFLAESIVTIIYPLTKLSAIPLMNFFTPHKPMGVTVGFIFASALAALVTFIFIYKSKSFKKNDNNSLHQLGYKKILQDSGHFIFFFATVTIILNLDTFSIMAILQNEYFAGLYTAVNNFSLVPYYLGSALFLVILPYITECRQNGDFQRASDLVWKNIKLIFIFIIPVVVMISASSQDLLISFYGAQYAAVSHILSLRIWGIFFLSVYVVINMAIYGLGGQRKSLIISIVMIVSDVVLQITLINSVGIIGASIATSAVAILGCVLSFIVLAGQLKNIIRLNELKPVLFILGGFSIIAIVLFNNLYLTNLVLLLVIYLIFFIVYLGILFKLKMISPKELLK